MFHLLGCCATERANGRQVEPRPRRLPLEFIYSRISHCRQTRREADRNRSVARALERVDEIGVVELGHALALVTLVRGTGSPGARERVA